MSKILEALGKLDATNDDHWTSTGDAKLDTVRTIAGDPSISRDQIVIAAPKFNRRTMDLSGGNVVLDNQPPSGPVTETKGSENSGVAGLPDAGSQQAEQTEVEARSELEVIEEQIARAETHLASIREEMTDLQNELTRGQHFRDNLYRRRDQLKPSASQSLHGDIRSYLLSEQRSREQRRAAHDSVGLTPETIQALARGDRSPLDIALGSRGR